MKKKDLKRISIMNAAVDLFSKYPYHKVAMDDIARQAKVAKGTLYYHFKSKEALYASLLYNGVDNLLCSMKNRFSENSIEENIKIFIRELTRFFHEKRSFFLVLQREESKVFNKKLSNCYKRFCTVKDILTSFLEEGKKRGIIKSEVQPSVITELIMGMIKNPVINGKVDPNTQSEAIIKILADGIFATPVPS